jgi:hypothetical protein
MKSIITTSISLFLFATTAFPALWTSREYRCEVNLPDGAPHIMRWEPSGSVEEGTLVGAIRQDRRAYVFLGYVDLSKEVKLHLNEKSIEQLEKRYFGEGKGFRHSIERISLHGIPGFRLTGRQNYQGDNFGLVVDMYEINGFIYQLAAMKEDELHPLQDPDIKAYMDSFRALK